MVGRRARVRKSRNTSTEERAMLLALVLVPMMTTEVLPAMVWAMGRAVSCDSSSIATPTTSMITEKLL